MDGLETSRSFHNIEAVATLMQAVGFAVWQLQELETTAAVYLVIKIGNSAMTTLQKEDLFAYASKRTLGQLIAKFEKKAVLDASLAESLKKAIENRNWLVHRARRENRGLLADQGSFQHLLTTVSELDEEALRLLKLLGGESRNS